MFIRITTSPNKKYKKVYLVESYLNNDGKYRQRIIKKYGNLDDLIKKDRDALAKLKMRYSKRGNHNRDKITIDRFQDALLAKNNLNYGYFYIEKVYRDLQIDKIISQKTHHLKSKYDLNEIMKLLVFSRIMNPSSKMQTYLNQKNFFEPFSNKLHNIYRSLGLMNQIKEDVQITMHSNVQAKIGRDVNLVLYDLTNYYFETEVSDDFKKPGVSKEKKTNPIVQMGLLIDKNKIPIGYKLFPGNVHDSKTAIPIMKDLKEKFKIKRTILVADKGINTSANFMHIASQGDGYIVSQKIRGSKKAFIDEVLNEKGYQRDASGLKYKEIKRTRNLGNGEFAIKEKVIIYWSAKFARKEKYKREKLNQKIESFLNSPAKLNASNAFGIKRYIKPQYIDQKTGEIIKLNQRNTRNIFNLAKYNRDVALDGYYAIATSEIDKPAIEIIASYKELWKIEESFKVIKSDLEGRPVFVQRQDRIEGHFLICFIALTIIRILQRQLQNKYTSRQIKDGLKNAMLTPLNKDDYHLHKKSEIINSLESLNNSLVAYRFPTLEQLRRVKKEILHYKI